MKALMLGNEAVARGLYEAGVTFASSYPGTPSTEITEAVTQYEEIYSEWAPNEKVAFEASFGACIGGARSFSAMKHVGLNVAADPLFVTSYTGAWCARWPPTPACIPHRTSRIPATTPSPPKPPC